MGKRPPRRPKSARAISNPHGVYSHREVCELTTMSRQNIYVLRKEGLFPQGRTLGKRTLVWAKDVIHLYLAGMWKPDPSEPGGDNDDGTGTVGDDGGNGG